MNDIVPGILEKDWNRIQERLNILKSFTNKAHIDLIDGEFAKNFTFNDPESFKNYSDIIDLELHMMVKEPINFLEDYGKAGFKRFLGHIEFMSDQEEFIKKAREYGEAGLAIDGPTSISEIKVPFNSLDVILIMNITAGYSGQEFNEASLKKIEEIKKTSNVLIEVDGGINDKTLPLVKNAGASRFVATSFLSNNFQENFELLSSL